MLLGSSPRPRGGRLANQSEQPHARIAEGKGGREDAPSDGRPQPLGTYSVTTLVPFSWLAVHPQRPFDNIWQDSIGGNRERERETKT